MHFSEPPGDCHIKYGYIKGGRFYVVKIASGFPDNPKHKLSSGNGLIILFEKQTGKPHSIFLDEGYLTDVRTAVAGCIAAKYLAPKKISCIGIVGTGTQAFYQLKFLRFVTKCKEVMIWGRSISKAKKFKNHPDLNEWEIEVVDNLEDLTANCNLIVMCTSSSQPLLFANHLRPGMHITAIGADDVGKQEIDPEIFSKTQKIIVDSKNQCKQFGDVSSAIKKNYLKEKNLIELGAVIADQKKGKTSKDEITIASLTGIAVQDLQIATSFFPFENLSFMRS